MIRKQKSLPANKAGSESQVLRELRALKRQLKDLPGIREELESISTSVEKLHERLDISRTPQLPQPNFRQPELGIVPSIPLPPNRTQPENTFF
ncbi:hypothetical protein [Alicyclobacillus acidiphilus]|uniref:hypothetical protein n=1 Tax=Alicyclobacillus acidiphilus TaxID=182455 RepID=UPI00082BF097|nr:hypothetical protein [Alicyclobacillus acidiphilus]